MAPASPREPCPTSGSPDDNDDDERRRIGAEIRRGPFQDQDRPPSLAPITAAGAADHDLRPWPLVVKPASPLPSPASVLARSDATTTTTTAAPVSQSGPTSLTKTPASLLLGVSTSTQPAPLSAPSAAAQTTAPSLPALTAATATGATPSPAPSSSLRPPDGILPQPPPLPRLPYAASGSSPSTLSPGLPKLPPLSALSPTPPTTSTATPATAAAAAVQTAISSAVITPSPSPSSAPLQKPESSQPPAMSNYVHNAPHGPPRLPSTSSFAPYSSSPSPYPPPALSPSPYGYGGGSSSLGNPGPPGSVGGMTAPGGGPTASSLGGMSDIYRQPSSAGPSPMSQPLPSMRTIDPLQLPPPPNTTNMHLGPPPQQVPPTVPPPQSLPPSQPMGCYSIPPPYGLPPPQFGLAGHMGHYPDIRMPAMGMSTVPRHKKEIKRRTKTGCMTCRKRRIKCDETHPTCNNCKKSKRECAGYDPIFKPQSQSPGIMQNSPSATPGSFGSATNTETNRTSSTSITPTAAAAVAAAAAAAASTASTLAAIKSPAAVTAPPPMPPASRSPMEGMYTTHPSDMPNSSSYNPGSVGYQPSTYPQRSILVQPDDHLAVTDPSGQVYKSKMKIEEIIAMSGPTPPQPTTTPSREALDDLVKYYYDSYVPGLTTFFETTWYKFKSSGITNPISILLNNRSVTSLLASHAANSFAKPQIGALLVGDSSANPILEMNLVWSLACMAYVTPATVNLPRPEPLSADNAAEARNRLVVIDALLSGGCLRTNPCLPPPEYGDRHRIREHRFWWWLAEYLRLQHEAGWNSTPGNSMTRLREQALVEMFNLQDGRENREIIYAIAILRDLAPRFPSSHQSNDYIRQQPGHYAEEDPRIQLAAATKCLRKAASEYGSSFSVARRMALLGIKAFVDPGYNIRKP